MPKKTKNSKSTSKLSDEKVNGIRILRANGATYEQISGLLGVSEGSVAKYGKDVQILPKHLQKNPFELLQMEAAGAMIDARIPTVKNMIEQGIVKDIDYYIENHVPGDRFKGDLDKISLADLQEVMETPTGYHSDLSLYDWCVYYLGGRRGGLLMHKPHMWSNLQKRMLEYFEKYPRLMIETFRDAGKTMIASAILLHEICENPDNNYFIMSETASKAALRIHQIGNILLTNKKLIADYGFLPHTSKYQGHRERWTQNQITVKRHFKQTDPTLMAFSSDSSNATGAHFAGGVFDDVWSFKLEQNCIKNKEKWLGWYDGELEGCLENAWELWLLTRKGPTDLYQDIEDRQFHVVFKKPAIIKYPTKWQPHFKYVAGQKVFDFINIETDDGRITDDGNGRFSMEFFLEKKCKMDAVKFESEYQLNPIASKGKFWDYKDIEWFNGYQQFFHELKVKNQLGTLRVLAFMDMAFGKSARADYTAITIVCMYDNKYWFLELYTKRGATRANMVDMIRQACDDFPMLRELYIEADLHQSSYVDELIKTCPFIIIKPFLSRQESNLLSKDDSPRRVNLEKKPLRIWTQIEPIVTGHKLRVNKYLSNLKEFKDEFRTFPSCNHFDVLDSLGNNISCHTKKSKAWFVLSG